MDVPFSKFKSELVNVLVNEGFLVGSEKKSVDGKDFIDVKLKYIKEEPAIKELKRISKPSLRRYSGPNDLGAVKNGLGVYILTTNVGGEIICEVF